MTHIDKNKIIVVDDDIISLKLIQFVLCKSNYLVKTFHSGQEVFTYLEEHSLNEFSCIISDFRMSEMDGLELFQKLTQTDPDLSTILFSADSDKEIISRALKNQVFDFLEKPLQGKTLVSSVKKAINNTQRKRLLRSNNYQVQEITGIHKKLSQLKTKNIHTNLLPKVKNIFYPLKETGGDFVNLFHTNEQCLALLAGDVSGHDLKAGFISTYCQGMIRGMVNTGASLKDVAKSFNDFLLKIWNSPDSEGCFMNPVKTSLSVCFLLFDLKSRHILCLNNGFPHPILSAKKIATDSFPENGPPLGWFEDCPFNLQKASMPGESTIYFWSDGLEDFSKDKKISYASAAYYLVHKTDSLEKSNFVKSRKDDLLVVHISWKNNNKANLWHPIFDEEYDGEHYEDIDKIQEIWQNSLLLLFCDKNIKRVNEILLCLREGVLNAMLHGCKKNKDKKCWLRTTYCPGLRTLNVEIEDQGTGFSSPSGNSETRDHQSLGILIMQSYGKDLNYTKGGTQLNLEFKI